MDIPTERIQRLELIEALLDQLPDFFYIHNSDLRFQYVNQAAADYFGHTKQSIVGLRHSEVDEPEQAAYFEDILLPIIASGETIQTDDLKYIRKDGTDGLLQAYIVPFRHPLTDEPMMLGISKDVTKQRQAEEEQRRRAAYEQELEIARSVQQSLLPMETPSFPGLDIASFCEPAAFVGGDFYDFITTPDGRLIIVLGDVTGHGVGPALLAASARSYSRVLFATKPLVEAMGLLDELLSRDLPDGAFVTFVALEIAPDATHFRMMSAGHGPLFLQTPDGESIELPVHTLPLGLGGFAGHDPVETLLFQPGSAVILLSDGLIESANDHGELLGKHRLTDALDAKYSAAETCDACLDL